MKTTKNPFSIQSNYILFFLIILISGNAFSQVNLQNGLIAKYQFNQSLADSGPNNLNAVSFGGPTYIDDRNSAQNSAISLDGIDDYIKVADDNQFGFGTGDFSVSFWVNKQVLTAQSQDFQNSFGVNQWASGSNSAGQNEWSLGIANGNNTDYPAFSIESGTTIYKVVSSGELTLEEWHHVVGVRDGDNIKIYLDGILRGSTNIPSGTSVNEAGNDLMIGTNNPLAYRANAQFDDISIYDRALNDAEILELFQPTNGTSLWSQNTNNIFYNGRVAVNTQTVPDGYEFAVKGDAIMEEIVVQLKQDWPDYVFDSSYNLPTLEETKKFILQNKHLKGIPSAQEVSKNGISLGEMNAKLLEKIEELTLYQIQLMELLQKQQTEIDELKKKSK